MNSIPSREKKSVREREKERKRAKERERVKYLKTLNLLFTSESENLSIKTLVFMCCFMCESDKKSTKQCCIYLDTTKLH